MLIARTAPLTLRYAIDDVAMLPRLRHAALRRALRYALTLRR